MTKITTMLSKKEYVKIIRNYLLSKNAYRFISAALFFIIIYSTVQAYFHYESTNIQVLIFWWILTSIYIGIIPYIITKRAQTIYDNTEFLHHPMYFSFNKEKIVWETKSGSREIHYLSIHKIETTYHAFVLVFSPYQILTIPYQDITQENWSTITGYIKPALKRRAQITESFYKKFHQK